MEKRQIVNCEEVSKILKKITSKGIKVDLLNIKIPKVNQKNIENIKINDFIDQFIYYRNLRGYTLEQVGQVIGVSGKYYNKYERRVHKLNDLEKIYKIANFLKIEEELLIPKERTTKINKNKLKEFLSENKISNSEFSRVSGISRRSIVDWFNTETEISEESSRKIKACILKLEKDKKKQGK